MVSFSYRIIGTVNELDEIVCTNCEFVGITFILYVPFICHCYVIDANVNVLLVYYVLILRQV